MLGALVGWKRPELALEIADRMPELQVTFAGAPLPGDDGALELRGRAPETGDVRRPRRRRPRRRSREHHVLLHCADDEPYGMVLVEALAAGRPVVAPAAGGPLEIVPDAGALPARRRRRGGRGAPRRSSADPDAPADARRRAEQHFDVRDSDAPAWTPLLAA